METRRTKGPWKWELGTSEICGANWNGGSIVVAKICADGLKYHENADKADLEAGANAEFIVRACNAHENYNHAAHLVASSAIPDMAGKVLISVEAFQAINTAIEKENKHV